MADDPVIASYDLILSSPPGSDAVVHDAAPSDKPGVLVLQYPAHRPAARPYCAALRQKPSTLRYKKATGIVEVDVPMLTTDNYNHEAGNRYGAAMTDSRTVSIGGSHGLVGGFNAGPTQVGSLHDVPAHQNGEAPPPLATQTLGGKIAKPSEKDPIYFLAAVRDGEIHLSHLDALVQLRPQLHHIDAEEENNQRRLHLSGGSANAKKPGVEITPKIESKAIEIKLKDSKEDPRDRSLNANTKLLRDIQTEPWQRHDWVDQDDALAKSQGDAFLWRNGEVDAPATLKSALSNSDWLDRMSAPREDGKKGLLAKLRGRERERARRKKAEEEKKKLKESAQPPGPSKGPLLEQSSDSELSSPDVSDLEQDADDQGMDVQINADALVEIKAEPEAEPAPSRRRGRPRKG
ncbi:uncharacterized protein AB675_4193 [Cyphellophora attinorum]|uniref:DNA-directed RNA polymerase III subunit rpc5 n=1 Tax=Cyphellophora attinorum TaxID=1664694 RepID=A0A0N1H1Y0_9EURO|nr:uncharacterized protein AB675_4193 [Phialophora attinorum]KPI38506.1 hypothetical protein AB675_4193 [Phialophora attinorum]